LKGKHQSSGDGLLSHSYRLEPLIVIFLRKNFQQKNQSDYCCLQWDSHRDTPVAGPIAVWAGERHCNDVGRVHQLRHMELILDRW
jgi:hypothetical protein